jgi:hypothetical protein
VAQEPASTPPGAPDPGPRASDQPEAARRSCAICGRVLDGEAPAIGETWTGSEFTWTYHPFLADLTKQVDRLYHPVCLAHTYGVDQLVDVIHARDIAERHELAEMAARLEFLKQQLLDADHPAES